MIFLKAFILAVVEGITEFLPISSTGHMVLVDAFMQLSPDEHFSKAFIVAIQLPAIMSVVVYFWAKLWPFGVDGKHLIDTISIWVRIIIGFLPAAVMGVLFNDKIEEMMGVRVVCAALIIGGILLILIERRKHTIRHQSVATMPIAIAFAIGVFQCLAMIPGTSRSAATIIGAMLLGASRAAAAEFAFFLAIPTMLGATTLSLLKHGLDFTGEQWAVLAFGSIVSFLVAYVAVAGLMRYIQRRDFQPFGYYRIALGLAVIAYLAVYGTAGVEV